MNMLASNFLLIYSNAHVLAFMHTLIAVVRAF